MSSSSRDHTAPTTRAGVAGDVHDIRALTDTGAIRLPGRAPRRQADRTPSEGNRATPPTAG